MVVLSDRWSQTSTQNSGFCRCGFLHLNQSGRSDRLQPLWIAISLLAVLFVAEFGISYWSHSLALLADASHMLVDVAVLGLTLAAAYVAQRPATGRATFGLRRVEILVALINGLSLIVVAVFVALEVADRLRSPEVILGLPMLLGASLGLAVNAINVCLLYRSSQQNLNLKSAFLHVAADAASSVGLVIASLVIHFYHWLWADAAVSLVIAIATGLAAIPLIKESLEIFLEIAPGEVDPARVGEAIAAFAAVEQVEMLRVWALTPGEVVLSTQIRVRSLNSAQRDELVREIQAYLSQQFGIREATVQLLEQTPANKVLLHPLLHRSLTDYVRSKT